MANKYVAWNGNDGNDGSTRALAKLTYASVLGVQNNGDIVYGDFDAFHPCREYIRNTTSGALGSLRYFKSYNTTPVYCMGGDDISETTSNIKWTKTSYLAQTSISIQGDGANVLFTSVAHKLITGQTIIVSNVGNTAVLANGNYDITWIDADSFTIVYGGVTGTVTTCDYNLNIWYVTNDAGGNPWSPVLATSDYLATMAVVTGAAWTASGAAAYETTNLWRLRTIGTSGLTATGDGAKVTIAHTGHGLVDGQTIRVSTSTSTAVLPLGTYVITWINANSFSVVYAGTVSTSTVGYYKWGKHEKGTYRPDDYDSLGYTTLYFRPFDTDDIATCHIEYGKRTYCWGTAGYNYLNVDNFTGICTGVSNFSSQSSVCSSHSVFTNIRGHYAYSDNIDNNSYNAAKTGISIQGNGVDTVTFTSALHGLATGQKIRVDTTADAGVLLNETYTITNTGVNTFTVYFLGTSVNSTTCDYSVLADDITYTNIIGCCSLIGSSFGVTNGTNYTITNFIGVNYGKSVDYQSGLKVTSGSTYITFNRFLCYSDTTYYNYGLNLYKGTLYNAHCKFIDGIVYGSKGYGLWIRFAQYTEIYNCTLYGISGSGIYMSSSSNYHTIKNCTSCYNTAYGFEINADSTTGQVNSNNHAYGNTVGTNLRLNDLALITTDPLFVDRVNNDFHLTNGSPLVDAGLDLRSTVSTDYDGWKRPQGWGSDIGAYELPKRRIFS